MKTVYKYRLEKIGEIIEFSFPRGAVLLVVQLQDQAPTLWAYMDTNINEEKETKRVLLVGTGWDIGDYNLRYLGTMQNIVGLVWHAFEVMP